MPIIASASATSVSPTTCSVKIWARFKRGLDAAQPFEREGHEKAAEHRARDRRGAADHQHAEDHEGFLEIEGLGRERGDEVAPQAARDPGDQRAQHERAPAQLRDVGADRGGRGLVVARGAQQHAGARFLEQHGEHDRAGGDAGREVEVRGLGQAEQRARAVGHLAPVQHDGVQHDQERERGDHRRGVRQAHQRIGHERGDRRRDQAAERDREIRRQLDARRRSGRGPAAPCPSSAPGSTAPPRRRRRPP